MHVTLVAVDGTAERRRLHIKLPAVLGRSRRADLTIAHLLISRKHCELREHEGVVYLKDLGSLNGTFCRNHRIQRVPLLPNDRFSIGPVTLEIDYDCSSREGSSHRIDAGAASGPPPILLPEPIEPALVELDDPIESSSKPNHGTVTAPQMRQRTQRLAGFTYREADAGRSALNEYGSDKLVEADFSQLLNDQKDVSFDAPTSQSQSTEKEQKANPPETSDNPNESAT